MIRYAIHNLTVGLVLMVLIYIAFTIRLIVIDVEVFWNCASILFIIDVVLICIYYKRKLEV